MQIFKLLYGALLAILLLPIHLGMVLLCWILSPILPLFAIGKDTLPKWLSWFQTPDAPLDGDTGFLIIHKNTPQYLQRIIWLIRNPAYGFSWSVLAARPPLGTKIITFGNLYSGDDPYVPGWSFSYIEGTHYFHVRAFIKTIPGKCLKSRLGWKFKGDSRNYQQVTTPPYKYTFTFNPFKARR